MNPTPAFIASFLLGMYLGARWARSALLGELIESGILLPDFVDEQREVAPYQ